MRGLLLLSLLLLLLAAACMHSAGHPMSGSASMPSSSTESISTAAEMPDSVVAPPPPPPQPPPTAGVSVTEPLPEPTFAPTESHRTVHARMTRSAHASAPPPPQPQPAPAPPPPQSNEAQIRESIAREYGDLNPATHAWNPPTSATLYKRQRVVYRIAPKGTAGNVTDGMPGAAAPWQQNVSARMKAQLAGPGFDIDPKEPAERTLLPGQAVEWSWWVTPQESGKQTLQLNTALVLKYGSSDHDVPLPVRTQDVDVSFSLIGWAFFHWQLMLSSILLPAGGWACKECWQRLRKTG